jgi:hypothetical protein
MNKPNFMIVGAPKSGTTSMYKYLRQHPEIFMPDEKEPHFFGADLNYTSLSIKSKEEYLSRFSEAKCENRIGEASVWYLYSKKAAYEIKELFPFAKIIIMLRNPIDMVYSLHNFFVDTGREDIQEFESAIELEKLRKQGFHIPYTLYSSPVECLLYRDVAKYTQQIKRYIEVFGRSNIHFIIFDDFKNKTSEVYRQTLSFLEVDEHFQPEFQIVNAGRRRHVRNKTLRNLVRNPLSLWLVQNIAPHPGKGLPLLLKLWGRLNNRYEPIPEMNPETRKRLQQEFTEEVEQLSELIGRDLTHWVKN